MACTNVSLMIIICPPSIEMLHQTQITSTSEASKKNGFTLIELIIVIVILGILSVTAAPRFINISTDATVSAVNGMKGALHSAISLIHAKAVIKGLNNGYETLALDGSVDINLYNGYPTASFIDAIRYTVRLDDISQLNSTSEVCEVDWCGKGWETILPSGITTTDPGRVAKIVPKGYSFGDLCGVYYVNHIDDTIPITGVETSEC